MLRHTRTILTLLSLLGLLTWLLLRVIVPGINADYVFLQSRADSCGPAAAATLLNFYLNCPTSEAEMIRLSGSGHVGDFSLLDLQRAVEQKHRAAINCKMTLPALQQQLNTFSVPILVCFHNPSHFSILLYMDDAYCYLADPTLGNIALSRNDMANMWLVPGKDIGYALVVGSAQGVNVERIRQIVGGVHNEAQRCNPQTWFIGWARQIQGYGF